MTYVPPNTTHKATQELGEAVENGVLRWVSASLATQGDHASEGGCLKRLWFERCGGKARVETEAMKAGTKMHAENEAYLRTDNRNALGPIGLAGIHYMPKPGPDLLLEHPLIIGGDGKIDSVYLFAAGVPWAGHVDCFDHRGEYPDHEGDWHDDPPNTLHVWDWKSTSALKWAKSAKQVADTIQMCSYAMGGFKMWPHLERSRLTHVYFQRNGKRASQLATSLPPREHIEKKWAYTEGLVRTIVDVVREQSSEHVPANTKACRSYQTNCPHLGYCAEGKRSREFNSLDECFGPRLAERLTARAANQPPPQEILEMGFLDELSTPVTPPAGVGIAFSLDDLVAEETAARAANDVKTEISVPSPEFTNAVAFIGAHGLGMPPLGGEAAELFAACGGQAVAPGATFPGSGKLGKIPEMTLPGQLLGLAEELKRKFPNGPAIAAAPTPVAPTPIAPPDAPASNPAIAALPVEGLATPKARELAAIAPPTEIPGLLASVPSSDVFTAPAAVLPEPEKKKGPGRPRKERTITGLDGDQIRVAGYSASGTDAAINLYADVVVEGVATVSLMTYVNHVNEFLVETYSDMKGADVRFAPGPLDYAKWRGAIAALVKKQPPEPGNYHLDTRGNEIAELVFVSLREIVIASGGVHVRGAR